MPHAEIARQGQTNAVQVWSRNKRQNLYSTLDPITSIKDEQKTALIVDIERKTRELDQRIEQVIISLNSSQDLILIAASDGTLAADIRPLVRLNVSVIVEDNGRREQGYAGGGARA